MAPSPRLRRVECARPWERCCASACSSSAAILLTGYVVGLIGDPASFGSHAVEQAHLAGRAGFPHSFTAVWHGIMRGSGEAIIVAGVLLLILTPVAGLLTSAVAFARRRDWLFTSDLGNCALGHPGVVPARVVVSVTTTGQPSPDRCGGRTL